MWKIGRRLRERPTCEGQERPFVFLPVPLIFVLLLFAIGAGSAIGVAKPFFVDLPSEEGSWIPSERVSGRMPSGDIIVNIRGIGRFPVRAAGVETLRSDIFQPSHFSVFDLLVHLHKQGEIDLLYHFDGSMNTHVIDSINGEESWWYEAHYDNGWFERNVTRMDMYPVKDGMFVTLSRERTDRLAAIYQSFAEEVNRLEGNGGRVVIPEVVIRGPRRTAIFRDVVVAPHGIRSDVLQPEVITGVDILLSLGEQGKLSGLRLTWYDQIGSADPVDSYFTEHIGIDEDSSMAFGSCGFVYELGPRTFGGFSGSHVHIPSDVRAIVSPEYAEWFWICL